MINPTRELTWPLVGFQNYNNNYFYLYINMVNGQPNLWPDSSLRSAPESGFKIMITIFIFMLTQVNGQPDPWLVSCPSWPSSKVLKL
jgi:hypothetical protein